MLVKVVLGLIIAVNGVFVFNFLKDIFNNKDKVINENGNPIVMAISQFLIFFFSTFGISDFAIGASLYPKLKWLNTKKLPGTLNTACVIPVAVMALSYISTIEVGLLTLATAIISQVLGAYLTPKYVVKLPIKIIKIFISIGLIVAASIILSGKFNIFPIGGTASSLSGAKLVVLGVLSFIFGALNNIGIGSYALTMAATYALGLSPAIAFPIMMGACTFSVPIGSIQFIKLDSYSRKITLFSAIFGVLGVLTAVFVVKSLNVSTLQWIVVSVIIYSAVSIILSLKKGEE